MSDMTSPGLIATELSVLTGDNWSASVDEYGNAKLIRDGGLRIFLHVDYRGKGSATFDAGPLGKHQRHYTEPTPKIGVTLTRPAAIIARELSRRLIPDAEGLRDTLLARAQESAEHERRLLTTQARLVDAGMFATTDPGKASLRYSDDVHPWGDASIYSDSVTLELHNLTPDQAVAILRVIAQ